MLLVRLSILLCAACLLPSCGSPTIPTPADMDRYYAQAESLAADRLASLEKKRRNGDITEGEYAAQLAAERARITDHATELAWARHENMEARLRALGVPTGGNPVQMQVPSPGGGESFYRRAGQPGGENFYSNAPYGGSVLGGPNRGDRPKLPPVEEPGGEPEPAAAPAPESEAPPGT